MTNQQHFFTFEELPELDAEAVTFIATGVAVAMLGTLVLLWVMT